MTDKQRAARNEAHLPNLPYVFRRKVRAIIAALEGWGWRPVIVESLRTLAEQEAKVAAGVSRTLRSKHLRQADGFAHAVDMVCDGIWWNDKAPGFAAYRIMQGHLAKTRGGVRWGGGWKSYGPWGDWAHIEYQPKGG